MKSRKKYSKWQLIELCILTVLTVATLIVGRAFILCKAEINESFAINSYQEQAAVLRLLEDNNNSEVKEGFDRLSNAVTVMSSDAIQAGFSQMRLDAVNRSDLSTVHKLDEKQRTLKNLGSKGKSDAEISQQNEILQDALRFSLMNTIKQVMRNDQSQFRAEIYFGILMFINGIIVSMLIANFILKRSGSANIGSSMLVETN